MAIRRFKANEKIIVTPSNIKQFYGDSNLFEQEKRKGVLENPYLPKYQARRNRDEDEEEPSGGGGEEPTNPVTPYSSPPEFEFVDFVYSSATYGSPDGSSRPFEKFAARVLTRKDSSNPRFPYQRQVQWSQFADFSRPQDIVRRFWFEQETQTVHEVTEYTGNEPPNSRWTRRFEYPYGGGTYLDRDELRARGETLEPYEVIMQRFGARGFGWVRDYTDSGFPQFNLFVPNTTLYVRGSDRYFDTGWSSYSYFTVNFIGEFFLPREAYFPY